MLTQAIFTILFYVFAALAIIGAIAVTISRRLLRAAVYLMGVLLVSAAMYVMLGAEFLAGIQVLVYVGGIVVVIVFAVMLTQSAHLQLDTPPRYRKIAAALAAIAFATLSSAALLMSNFNMPQNTVVPADNAKAIGLLLLDRGPTGYVLPFEIISVLLLAAVIGGIVIARKTPPPDQPFTSGGDMNDEADVTLPKSQHYKPAEMEKV
jgi:NADH-quinone oxidoreductase subunit J